MRLSSQCVKCRKNFQRLVVLTLSVPTKMKSMTKSCVRSFTRLHTMLVMLRLRAVMTIRSTVRRPMTRLSLILSRLMMLLIQIFQKTTSKKNTLLLTATLQMFSAILCAVAFLIQASVWTVVQQMRFVLSGARLILCQCHTEVHSSSVVKQCLSLLVLSVQRWMRRWLITYWRRATSASSFIIISLHSVQVRLRPSVV